jgi:hypothetical protein
MRSMNTKFKTKKYPLVLSNKFQRPYLIKSNEKISKVQKKNLRVALSF